MRSDGCYQHYTFANSVIGVDSEQLQWANEEEVVDQAPLSPVEQTIEEDKIAEAEGHANVPEQTPRKAKRSSYQRLSKLSDEARLSISSLSLSPEKKGTDSNRSSVTIRGPQVNGTNATLTWNETDFENALKKFAAQRDSFLTDLDLTAGAIVPSRPKPRPKTQRIVNEEVPGTRSGIGSIRRRLSTRNMNSAKRQSSVKRQCMLKEPITLAVGLRRLTHPSYGFSSNLEAPEQLQLCHTQSATSERRSKHTSTDAQIRTRPSR